MPENIVGKMVLVEGGATVKETSEEMRKHYAEDAGNQTKKLRKLKVLKKVLSLLPKV